MRSVVTLFFKQKMVNSYLTSLLHGVTNLIASLPNVSDIEIEKPGSCTQTQLIDWEKKNGVLLPGDVKSFYQMSDGLMLRWYVKVPEGKSVRVGKMEINSLSKLEEVLVRDSSAGMADLNACVNSLQLLPPSCNADAEIPQLGGQNWKIFRICADDAGTVCLVFKKRGADVVGNSIWLLDPALTWYRLASSFTAYFRIMLVHLGLPDFQLFYTSPYGPRASSLIWYRLFVPQILSSFHNQTDILFPSKLIDASAKTSASVTARRVAFDRSKAFKSSLASADKKKQVKS